jgi:hypothetical protein
LRKLVIAGCIVGLLSVAAPAQATIHPIVESADCAEGDAHHPLGDVANPPGQTPEFGSHSEQSTLRALNVANLNAFGKENGDCGSV